MENWIQQELMALTRSVTTSSARIEALIESHRSLDRRMARQEGITQTVAGIEDRLQAMEEHWERLSRLVRWALTLGAMALALLPALGPEKIAKIFIAAIRLMSGL